MSILDYKTYAEAHANFSWSDVWDLFQGTRNKINIAYECVDRHVDRGLAVRIKFDDGRTEEHSFQDLAVLSSKVANALLAEGIVKGDRVAVMLDPSLEFYGSLYGIIKCGAIAVPFYPQFGPDAIEARLKDSEAKIMITTPGKAKDFDNRMVDEVITVGEAFDKFVRDQPETYQEPINTSGDDIAVYQYTSGTTRKYPEAIKHFHKSVPVLIPTAVFALGMRRGDRYFCVSTPSWGHGLWYGTMAPLALGIPVGAYSGKFSEQRVLEALEEFEINNLTAAPTAYRRLKNCGLLDNYQLKINRLSYSMEPMDTDTFEYLKEKFGASPCSFYGSTEVGVLIANYNGYPDYEIKPRCLGKPMMGLDVAVIDDLDEKVAPGQIGEIAVKRKNGWFRVKDAGVVDEEGYFWHKGRSDDVIISSGWTISSAEVEDAIQKHPAVEEVVVVGAPDKDRGLIVKAYIKSSRPAEEYLKTEIMDFVKTQLSKHEYPRSIEFVNEIPKTTGGKIDRMEIKKWAAAVAD